MRVKGKTIFEINGLLPCITYTCGLVNETKLYVCIGMHHRCALATTHTYAAPVDYDRENGLFRGPFHLTRR